ncbi:FAD-binding domain-containing protein [Thozetella sp. PMI_491]|nr:FAD-binding domain-containing protein [Thozetella sp. PMI_491]
MTTSIGPLSCEVVTPDPSSQSPRDVISRWSDNNVELPALIVKPHSEDDIIDAIRLAKEKGLTLLPASGGHGSFVPVTPKTLYLDLKAFNSVVVDKEAATVRVGGGATTGEVIKAVTDQGFYTLWPNSNSVGYVGCILGGGNGVINGHHGFMVDAVESFQLISADGRKAEVDLSSTGEERALFGALCGAGHGLGVVTSVVVKIWPLAGLAMRDDSIWTRRLIFPPSAIDLAADTFARFVDPPPALVVTMLFMRAPPNAPAPGAPMIMLSGSYYGPPEEAEQAASRLLDENLSGKAIKAETVFVPMATANNTFEVLNMHGGHKDICSRFLHSVETATLKTSFDRWLQVGEQYPDAKPTIGIWSRFSVRKSMALGQSSEGQPKFLEIRDRGVMASTFRSCSTPGTKEALDIYTEEFLNIASNDQAAPARTLANNQRPNMDLGELHTQERLVERRRLGSVWDAEHLFWSPY